MAVELRFGHLRPGELVHIDDELIQRVFGIEVCHKKDGAQRPVCGCVQSRGIGIYNSCLFGWAYYYAAASFTAAAANHRKQDPGCEALFPGGQ